jgi:hypothetical protein
MSRRSFARFWISVLLVAFAGLYGAREAEACSCMAPGAACEDYWKASAVFLGRVQSISPAGSIRSRSAPARRRVTFTVIEAFSGVRKGTLEVTTGSGGGDCGYPFREGGEYVVYANGDAPGGPLSASVCSRTREVSRAADDLAYARSVVNGTAAGGRIGGEVLLATRTLVRIPVRDEPRPLPGIGVRLESEGHSARVVTGPDGKFSAEALPPGRYLVTLEMPEGLYAEVWPKAIELRDPSSCAEVRGTAFADGRVTGRALDGAGRPIPGLTIELTAPVGLDEPDAAERLRDLTDHDGRYEIVHVPAGRFVVGINTQPGRSGGAPEPRILHPGVPSPTGATRVMLKRGERVSLGDFRIPPSLVFIPVSGVVLSPDGAPVSGARVYLKGPAETDFILSEPAITDATGRFQLAALQGRSYRLFAEWSRDDVPNAAIDSSDQVAFTAASPAPSFKLSLRRRY